MTTQRRGALITGLAAVGVLTVQELAIAPRFGGHPGVFLLMYVGILGSLYTAGLSVGRALGKRALSVGHKTGASIETNRSPVVVWVRNLTMLGVGLAAVVVGFYFATASSTEVRVGYLGDRHRCGSPLYPNTTGCGSVAATRTGDFSWPPAGTSTWPLTPWVSAVLITGLSAVVGLVLAVSWIFLVLGFIMSQ